MKRSFYEILGVPHDADQATIDAAYGQATARVNEDIKRGGAEASMEAQLLRDGYQLLSDPAKRARYDAKLSAAEHGVQLMFFPDDKKSQRALGVQTFVFAIVASALVAVVFWQMNRKISEVRADYDTVVARKQSEKEAPKVVQEVPAEQAIANATEAAKSGTGAPKVSDFAKTETVYKVVDAPKTDANAKGAPENQAKR